MTNATETTAEAALRAENADLHARLNASRGEVDAIRNALGVPYEPHKTLRERMIESASRHRRFEERLAAMEEADSSIVRGLQAEVVLLRAELAFERRPRGIVHRMMRAIFPPPAR